MKPDIPSDRRCGMFSLAGVTLASTVLFTTLATRVRLLRRLPEPESSEGGLNGLPEASFTPVVVADSRRQQNAIRIVIISKLEVGGNVPQQMLNYLNSGAYRLHLAANSTLPADFFAQLPGNAPYAFFIDPADMHALNLIQRHFIVQP